MNEVRKEGRKEERKEGRKERKTQVIIQASTEEYTDARKAAINREAM